MDHFLPLLPGASYEPQHSAQPQQQQQFPLQAQHVASYQPTLPRESEMPDEWGYSAQISPQGSSTSAAVRAAPGGSDGPVSLSGLPPPRDAGLENGGAERVLLARSHAVCTRSRKGRPDRVPVLTEILPPPPPPPRIRDAVERLGFPVCPACGNCPSRTDSEFCGLLCQMWAEQRREEQELQEERRRRSHPQDRQHQRPGHQPYPKWQSSTTLAPSGMLPNPSPVSWSNADTAPESLMKSPHNQVEMMELGLDHPQYFDEHRWGEGYPDQAPPPYSTGRMPQLVDDGPEDIEYEDPYQEPGMSPTGRRGRTDYRDDLASYGRGSTRHGSFGEGAWTQGVPYHCPRCGTQSLQGGTEGEWGHSRQGGGGFANAYAYGGRGPTSRVSRCANCGFSPRARAHSQPPPGFGLQSGDGLYDHPGAHDPFAEPYAGMDAHDYSYSSSHGGRFPQPHRPSSMAPSRYGPAYGGGFQQQQPYQGMYGNDHRRGGYGGDPYAGSSMGMSSMSSMSPGMHSYHHDNAATARAMAGGNSRHHHDVRGRQRKSNRLLVCKPMPTPASDDPPSFANRIPDSDSVLPRSGKSKIVRWPLRVRPITIRQSAIVARARRTYRTVDRAYHASASANACLARPRVLRCASLLPQINAGVHALDVGANVDGWKMASLLPFRVGGTKLVQIWLYSCMGMSSVAGDGGRFGAER
ncbi:hypothetical protein F5148DRAFT_1148393 [Russula earlei]|uniref:Uncharacterized protein n=1 Tax=Russula earlei TaxID=71964 RepID=A0ACC0UCG2_9AGAM|nr:hypothetical protein F5148DRAFT_1148393 [Russula earlei]